VADLANLTAELGRLVRFQRGVESQGCDEQNLLVSAIEKIAKFWSPLSALHLPT